MINGGIKPNVIPDICEAIMDFRLLPGQTTEMVLDAMKKLINSLGYDVKDEPRGSPEQIFVYLEVLKKGEGSYWNNWRDSKDLKLFHNVVQEIYKKEPIFFILPASSDAEHYRNTGYCRSAILFGPGSAGTAHAIDEYIEIEDFIDSIKVYTLFAAKFLK
jgi:acetylornithine deacetylase/succinyl-diaminopimelate desuccinylase-like protein